MSWILNDAPPKYGEELAECQRYFYRLSGQRFRLSGCTLNSLYFDIPLPAMRARPAITCKQSDTITNSWIRTVTNGESLALSGLTYAIDSYKPGERSATVVFVKNAHGITDAMLAVLGYMDFSCEP